MTVSKAQQAATARYKAKTYKRIPFDYPLTDVPALATAAAAAGESVNGYIKEAIKQRMDRDQAAAGRADPDN